VAGQRFPDLALPDSDGNLRRLSELAGPDPLLPHTYRAGSVLGNVCSRRRCC